MRYKITDEDIQNMKNDLKNIILGMMEDKKLRVAILNWENGRL